MARHIVTGKADEGDLAGLLEWMEADYAKTGEGFWPNRLTVCDGVRIGDLYVAKVSGRIVGFQLGEIEPLLLQVRRTMRRKGIGTLLLRDLLSRTHAAGLAYCDVDILPQSQPFWVSNDFFQFNRCGSANTTAGSIDVGFWIRKQTEYGQRSGGRAAMN